MFKVPNNIDWYCSQIPQLHRRVLARIAVWLLDIADIKIQEWLVFKKEQSHE
jgi:hypothetical protein